MRKQTYKTKLKKFRKILEEAETIFITTHKRPDGDALGSTLALKIYLEKLGKQVTVHYGGVPENMYNFIPGYDQEYFRVPAKLPREYDVSVICDACELRRIGAEEWGAAAGSCEIGSYFCGEKMVFLDHHADTVAEPSCLEITDTKKAATSEIVFDYFAENSIEFGKDIATCLLAGLFTDTGGFMHSNTNSYVMDAASELMRKGAALSLIAKRICANKTVNVLNVWGRALDRAKLNEKNRMAFSYVTQKDLEECRAKVEDLSGVTNILGAAEESAYSLLLAEEEGDKLKGSLRSEEHKNCDVSKIAKLFGGGGHRLASGFELKGKIVDKKGEMAIA